MGFLKKLTHAGAQSAQPTRRHPFEIPFDELTDDSIVCTCAKITYADVKRELGFGIENADELLAELDAGNSCGKCVEYLGALIRHAKQEMNM